jgi:predicted XRE-type DNA-binding protein
MKKKNELPSDYFDDQEFLVDEIDEELVLGILGKSPSAEQLLKFELCTFIGNLINDKGMSLSQVQEVTNINASDISRIKNHHLERFTVDKLIKIYTNLDTQYGVGVILASAGEKIRRMSA